MSAQLFHHGIHPSIWTILPSISTKSSRNSFYFPLRLSSINDSISALSSSNESYFPWEFDWFFFVLFATGLLFLIVLLGASIWYWCTRTHRVRQRHSLPLAINDFIETSKIQEKRLSSSSPIKAPPVPPRPTAYTTVLGKMEYRSNLWSVRFD